MKNDPNQVESRWPAVAIWTVSGLLLGLAITIATGAFPVPIVLFSVIGLAVGLFVTRVKFKPEDD